MASAALAARLDFGEVTIQEGDLLGVERERLLVLGRVSQRLTHGSPVCGL